MVRTPFVFPIKDILRLRRGCHQQHEGEQSQISMQPPRPARPCRDRRWRSSPRDR
jgi:hypothetical protein